MKIKEIYDCITVGAGPAGLSSAVTAKEHGAKNVLIIERDSRPGGILLQCIHTGFGLFEFHEELTGPEYADRWIRRAAEKGVDILTDTIVLSIEESTDHYDEGRKFKEVTVSGIHTGVKVLKTKTVILAMGCRERTRGALGIPGTRPAGILTAGCAQKLVNIQGYMPGRKAVILGSGDIGLIMARRMTLEGAKIVAVCEKMSRPGGLLRNVQQCLTDFKIPLILSATVTQIHGKKRVEGVTVTHYGDDGKEIEESQEYIECDTVLFSVGLIPENELSREAGLRMDEKTGGPLLESSHHTSMEGVFACGNVYKVYDIVDNVSLDSRMIGKTVGAYLTGSRYKGSLRPETQKEDYDQDLQSDPDKRVMTCTICPGSCHIQAVRNEQGEWEFSGYSCKRGLDFARTEVVDPSRVLTTTVISESQGRTSMIPVRTNAPVPLRLMEKTMEEIKSFVLRKEVGIGDKVIENIAGTGIDVIASGN